MKRILLALFVCLLPHLALAQSLGYGIAFGLSPNNLSNVAGGSGYAAADTITLACTQPSIYSPYISFVTNPVVTIDTVTSGAVTTFHVTTVGATGGTFSNVAVSCVQSSTSGSGTGATFNGQLVPNLPPVPFLSAVAQAPTLSSCGTSPAVDAGSNSNGGKITLGTSTPTACTVTFASPYPTKAFCTVTPASSGGAAISGGYYLSAVSKTAFTLTIGTGTNSLVFDYVCMGN